MFRHQRQCQQEYHHHRRYRRCRRDLLDQG